MRYFAFIFFLALSSCRTVPEGGLERFEFSQPEMGLPFRIVLYAPTRETADAAAKAAFSRIHELNGVMSDYEETSELSRLSATAGTGKRVKVSADLWKVLTTADRISRMSNGGFDVTVGPLVDLWKRARRQRELPSPDRLAEALKAVGFEKIRFYPNAHPPRQAPPGGGGKRIHEVELTVPHMRLDLGGIAKGYALQEALKVIRKNGLNRALVTGGGDMAAGDPPPGSRGWRIEVAPLDITNAPPPRFVLLANRALTTSGDLFQRVEIGGKRYSHIVDPHTGIGLTDHSLVTIIADDATLADGLSKAVSVLGPKAGLALIERIPGAAAFIVRKPANELEHFESRFFPNSQ